MSGLGLELVLPVTAVLEGRAAARPSSDEPGHLLSLRSVLHLGLGLLQLVPLHLDQLLLGLQRLWGLPDLTLVLLDGLLGLSVGSVGVLQSDVQLVLLQGSFCLLQGGLQLYLLVPETFADLVHPVDGAAPRRSDHLQRLPGLLRCLSQLGPVELAMDKPKLLLSSSSALPRHNHLLMNQQSVLNRGFPVVHDVNGHHDLIDRLHPH